MEEDQEVLVDVVHQDITLADQEHTVLKHYTHMMETLHQDHHNIQSVLQRQQDVLVVDVV